MHYEYKIERWEEPSAALSTTVSRPPTGQELNELGDYGWLLVACDGKNWVFVRDVE